MPLRLRAASAIMLLCGCPVFAQEQPLRLDDCASIPDDRARLSCFDRLVANARTGQENAPVVPVPAEATPARRDDAAPSSILAEHWELGPEDKRGTFHFRPHRENYLIATYTHAPNNAPYRPFRALTPGAEGLSHAELAFQLGFKLKLAENPLNQPVDLWFGYTQQSFWQASNHEASSPFRETNYQPELMAVMPINVGVLGMRARFVNVGFVHQSNGQTSTLSRSWNRVYAQVGLERGDFTLLARVWQRINEPRATDDNPDIVDYLGRGDLVGTYRWNGHEFSALTRYNFSTDRGAVQLGWAFPMTSKLKGYVQYFSGYGQSLIDYNYFQRTIGFGFVITY